MSVEQPITLSGLVGELEGLLRYQSDIDQLAIVCHPHPLYGGTLHNKVVTTLTKVFAELGLNTLRFNSRGVGKSAGKFSQGKGEIADLVAVMQAMQQEYAVQTIWLAGFSFGAYVAFGAASHPAVQQLVCVAPAVTRFDFSALPLPHCPITLLQGDCDEVVEPDAVYVWQRSLPKPVTFLPFTDTGHFFHGKLVELRNRLVAHFSP